MNRVDVQQKVLSENDRMAGALREKLRDNGVYCPNFISSPGAGKTRCWSARWSFCRGTLALRC